MRGRQARVQVVVRSAALVAAALVVGVGGQAFDGYIQPVLDAIPDWSALVAT